MSDLAAVLIPVLAGVVGAVLIGGPWYRWSQRRKAQQDSRNIVVLLEWVEQMSSEQRKKNAARVDVRS